MRVAPSPPLKTNLHWRVFSRHSAVSSAARLSICCSGGSCCSRCSAGTCGIRSDAARCPRRRFLQSHLLLLRFERKRLWTQKRDRQWSVARANFSWCRSSGNWTDKETARHKSLRLTGEAGRGPSRGYIKKAISQKVTNICSSILAFALSTTNTALLLWFQAQI